MSNRHTLFSLCDFSQLAQKARNRGPSAMRVRDRGYTLKNHLSRIMELSIIFDCYSIGYGVRGVYDFCTYQEQLTEILFDNNYISVLHVKYDRLFHLFSEKFC